MPRVLVTGAAGAIGSAVTARLSDRWRLRATDLRAGDGIDALDITDADACHAAFAGLDAIVHLAGNPSPDANWSQLHGPNVTGTYVVAAAARDCAVPRLVLASSQQAVSAYPDTRPAAGRGLAAAGEPVRRDQGVGRGARLLGGVELGHVGRRAADRLLRRAPTGRRPGDRRATSPPGSATTTPPS